MPFAVDLFESPIFVAACTAAVLLPPPAVLYCQATAVNAAYDVLKRPLRRAHYIVRERGRAPACLPGAPDVCWTQSPCCLAPALTHSLHPAPPTPTRLQLAERGFGACEGMTISDPTLLMEVMEAREEVEGAPPGGPRLRELQQQNAALERQCLQVRAAAGAGSARVDGVGVCWLCVWQFGSLSSTVRALLAVCAQELGAAFAAGDLPHAAELTTQLRYITRIKEAIADKL